MGFLPLLELILAIRGTSKDLLDRMGMEDPEVSSLRPSKISYELSLSDVGHA